MLSITYTDKKNPEGGGMRNNFRKIIYYVNLFRLNFPEGDGWAANELC